MDEHREERLELEQLRREIWEPDRDDDERDLILDTFWDQRHAEGLIWAMRR